MKRDWKKWALAALVRALKTFFQTFAGCLTVGVVITEVDWMSALSASVMAFIYSIATSLGGLPEVDEGA